MREPIIAAQIFGLMLAATGLYIIGDWQIDIGLFLVLWGYGITSIPRLKSDQRPDFNDKNWVE